MNADLNRALSSRRSFLIAALGASALTRIAVSSTTPLRSRSFELEYKALVRGVPAGAQHLDLWLPVADSDPYQQVTKVQVDSPYPAPITSGREGNTILYVSVDQPDKPDFGVTVRLAATRKEHRQPLLDSGSKVAGEDPAALKHWLQPDRLVPLDTQIRSWAHEVAEAANAQTDLQQARAIYEHVVSTVTYDKSGKGWGRGDIYYACEARRGNCTDFHAIFIGYARALGIPARFAIGLPLPADRGEGKITGYHCWAEFYAKGIGWVPIDASEAAKDPTRREYFFGSHDENRIELSKGRDVILTPPQKGEPLNYFVFPYAEVDGKPFAGVSSEVTYRDSSGA